MVKQHVDGTAGMGNGKGRRRTDFSSKGGGPRPPAEMVRGHPHIGTPTEAKAFSRPEVSSHLCVQKLSSLRTVTCSFSSCLSPARLGFLQGSSVDETQWGAVARPGPQLLSGRSARRLFAEVLEAQAECKPIPLLSLH